ncbi:MAG: hypothetical protein NT166_00265 [Candidatus Aminicenantes bacterium]|nr:hypothetical protein [Candidatus Aminicenantes bacterium]
MNLKLFFFLVLLIPIMGSFSFTAVKTVPLPADVINPESINADANHLYIVDGASIHIVSLADFKMIKTFGKQGEGAQEFMINTWFRLKLSAQPNCLFIQSISRVSYFSKDGIFQKEQRLTSRGVNFVPLENEKGFIGSNTGRENNSLFFYLSLYDANFQKGITIFKEQVPFLPGAAFDPLDQKEPVFYAKFGKIFVNGRDGVIHIINPTGKEESAIKYDYGKLDVTQKVKDEMVEYYKTDPRTSMGFEMFKKDMKFSDYFPPVRDYRVANEKVYVFPFNKKEGKSQVFIFDMKGKLLKTLPVEMIEKNPLDFYPFAVENDKLYQAIENIDGESWELRVTDIK